MRNKGVDKLLQMPPVSDKRILLVIRILHFGVTASVSWNRKLLPLFCFRIVKLNMSHGQSEEWPTALALYGLVLSRVGYPLVEAEKYCIIALDMHKKLAGHDDSYYMAPLTMLTHGTTFTLTRKLSDCLAPLKAGYKSGFTSGECFCYISLKRQRYALTRHCLQHLRQHTTSNALFRSNWLGLFSLWPAAENRCKDTGQTQDKHLGFPGTTRHPNEQDL